MNPVKRSLVMSVALSVRKWAVEKAIKRDRASSDLCGWCGIASAQLFRALARVNITATLHYTANHCFLMVDDYIVDVTATQFRAFKQTPVLILHKDEADEYWFYQCADMFEYPAHLRDHQLKEKWPLDQIAYAR